MFAWYKEGFLGSKEKHYSSIHRSFLKGRYYNLAGSSNSYSHRTLTVKLRDPELSLPIHWLLWGMRRLASATIVSRREKKNKLRWMTACFIGHLRKLRKMAWKGQPCLFLTWDSTSMYYPKSNQELEHVWSSNAIIEEWRYVQGCGFIYETVSKIQYSIYSICTNDL